MAKEYFKWKMPEGNLESVIHNSELPAWFLNILVGRGIDTLEKIEAYLKPNYDLLPKADVFLNMEEAASRLAQARKSGERVVIYGDYDVDGITATALVYEALLKIGIEAETYIPHREEEGYGLNKEALTDIKKKGARLVIAVDCGISAKTLIDNMIDLDFIIVDHHTIDPDKIPKNAFILHPSLVKSGEGYQLSAAGIAYFLAVALMAQFPSDFLPGQEKWLLDLVALSTICDIVPLTGVNRILTHFGLVVLNKTKRVGLRALFRVAGVEIGSIDAYTTGFVLGPRLNAAGRLESAQKSLELLITKDANRANALAIELNRLNAERQQLCGKIVEEAKQRIEAGDKSAPINLLSDKNWPRGVVGIVASRMTDIYNRPTIIFEDDGEMHHGSARSVDGLNITELLSEVSDYTVKYGGHARAAGVTVSKDHFIMFKEKLIALVNKKLKTIDLKNEIAIDTVIKPEEINDEAMSLLTQLEPTGFGNRNPVFLIKKAEISNPRKVGQDEKHLKFNIKSPSTPDSIDGSSFNLLNVIWFNFEDSQLSSDFWDDLKREKYDLIFTLRYNNWKNQRNIELRLVDLRKSQ